MSVEPGFGGQKFMPMAIDKIKTFSEYAKLKGLNYEIEVDGGINAETAKSVIDAGATVLVVGSYLFSADDMEDRVKKLKSL
jgi:ribulose-phosphate 3-epimerase